MEEEIEVDYEGPEESPQKPVQPSVEDDVYGDLFDEEGVKGTLLKAKYSTLQEECDEQQRTIVRLKQQIETLLGEKSGLLEEKRILVRNISCVYRTAKEELDRTHEALKEKERMIEELQAALRHGPGQAVQHPAASGMRSS